MLLGSGITRLLTTVPGDIGSVAPASVSGPPADIAGSIGGLPEGPIAVVGGEVIAVDAEVSEPLTEHEAWLASARPGRQPLVAPVPSTDVAALGAALPPGARDPYLWIEMLTPVGGSVRAPVEVVAADAAAPHAPTAGPDPPASARAGVVVLERAGAGASFAAGVYELTASWTGPDGSYQARVWHVEIVPSPATASPSSPLALLGRWMAAVAAPGGVAGQPIVTDLDLVGGPGTGTCGRGATVTPADRLLAVQTPRGTTIVGVRLSRTGGAEPLPTRLMAGEPATGGLTLVALPAVGLAAGRYRLELVPSSGPALAYEVCVG